MVPTTFGAVMAFLVFAAPGLPWAARVHRRQSWRSEDSTFREIGQGVLWSVWFSAPATAITVGLLAVVSRTVLTHEDEWLVSGHPPNGATVLWAAVLALAELGLAMLLMNMAWLILAPHLYPGPEGLRESAWKRFLTTEEGQSGVSAQVRLLGGTVWLGGVRAFRDDNPWADREIVLSNPCVLKDDRTKGPILVGDLIVPAASIESVLVAPVRFGVPTEWKAVFESKPRNRVIAAWKLLIGGTRLVSEASGSSGPEVTPMSVSNPVDTVPEVSWPEERAGVDK